ncbi:hypothetical protein GGS23DRAFT_384667 [Durotheca rogersii]|uniref:uncharacterized protein n=1 Tax=Durotheca rogersii TaxID=419775 RepID=UPI00221ECD11|nr:uncharacterized protein GGS23DRAFT_384667 [Durotheca rogersii]KAI5866376.1 hypothetical protein GGS23DRAFT_384667 [Durotheca rogersii]
MLLHHLLHAVVPFYLFPFLHPSSLEMFTIRTHAHTRTHQRTNPPHTSCSLLLLSLSFLIHTFTPPCSAIRPPGQHNTKHHTWGYLLILYKHIFFSSSSFSLFPLPLPLPHNITTEHNNTTQRCAHPHTTAHNSDDTAQHHTTPHNTCRHLDSI